HDRRHAYREHRVAETFAGKPNQPGDKRTLAVIAPVELARPVPVVGFIGSEFERAVKGKIGEAQDGDADDQRESGPTIARRGVHGASLQSGMLIACAEHQVKPNPDTKQRQFDVYGMVIASLPPGMTFF